MATDSTSGEGEDTFIARLTVEVIAKVVAEIQDLRKGGKTEEDIRGRLDKRLRSYDPFTRARIYQKSLGKAIEDDIKAEQVESSATPKEGTLVLKVKVVPSDLREETLVQHGGEDYTVGSISGNSITLKKLLPLRKKK